MSPSLFITAALLAANTFQPVVTQELLSPTGQPRVKFGVLSEPLKGNLGKATLDWTLSNRDGLGLAAFETLRLGPTFATKFGASTHLVARIDDLDIYGAKLIVTVDEQGRVIQTSSSLPAATRFVKQWNVSSADAIRKVASVVPFTVLQPDGTPVGLAKPLFFEVGDALHSGFLVHVQSLDKTKNWYAAVDAVNGEVLFTQNRVHHQSLAANAYPISPGGLDAGVAATPTVTVQLTHADGGAMVVPNDGGFLLGTQLDGYNCCPTQNCQADGGAVTVMGSVMQSGFTVQYKAVVCQRTQRATNDGRSFEYTPADPPMNRTMVVASDPANSDEFAEVHSFYHVNRVYDWVRGLSANPAAVALDGGAEPFMMRDERLGKKPLIWSNVMFPNISELTSNPSALIQCVQRPPCEIKTLMRIDNAAFFPKENFAQIPVAIPGFDTGVDTLMIFQGNSADAAYDATVIQHEFGHGVVYATAELTFDALAIDARSANAEGGALHEGFADYIAAAFNNEAAVGPYFGPRALASTAGSMIGVRQDAYLRTMTNTLSCPNVLWGEVHQDSQHVAGALWDGRLAMGDNAKYDAAFYSMLVGIAPTADFAEVAATMADRVKRAFPTNAMAQMQMNTIFAMRGVTGCSKVLQGPITTPRSVYQISAAPMALRNQLIPGPVQIRVPAVQGAKRIRLGGMMAGGGLLGGAAPTVKALAKAGSAITFTRTGNTLTNDATYNETASASGALTGLDVAVPCGANQELYVTLASTTAASISGLTVEIDPLVNCMLPMPDAGQPDAGRVDAGAPDAGPVDETKRIELATFSGPAGKEGCGCTNADALLPLLGLAFIALRRRAQR